MKSYWLAIALTLSGFFLVSCNSEKSTSPTGTWRAELQLDTSVFLPFIFSIDSSETGLKMVVHNGAERLEINDLEIIGDSLFIPMLHFDTELKLKVFENEMKGVFIKNYRENYRIPFHASRGNSIRFRSTSATEMDISGSWEVHFEDYQKTGIPAIGEFSQQGSIVNGTFLTHTGDYRYLEGVADGNKIRLSTFDGEHAFLFVADLVDDTLSGVFFSGTHWKENWTAFRNPDVPLPSPNDLTKGTNPEEKVTLSFPTPDGRLVSLDDEPYKGRPVILQILGTWCPNCMDEAIFLGEWYTKRKENDPEILGLAFERKNDLKYAGQRIKSTKEKLALGYEVLFAGPYQKDSATARLPFIDQVISYPTMIFLDSSHHIQTIHTGFSGPGTGKHYKKFKEDFELMVRGIVD